MSHSIVGHSQVRGKEKTKLDTSLPKLRFNRVEGGTPFGDLCTYIRIEVNPSTLVKKLSLFSRKSKK